MAYNTYMRFEVPQFIEIEDKIFGPFTWRQFVYLAGGVGLALVLLFIAPFFIFVVVGVPVGGLAILLAFYPVNNRPFANFLESMVYFYKNSRVYHWHKKADVVYRGRTSASVTTPKWESGVSQTRGISSLARKLEMNALQKK